MTDSELETWDLFAQMLGEIFDRIEALERHVGLDGAE